MTTTDDDQAEITERPESDNNGTEWDEAMAELDVEFEEFKDSLSEWKTGLLNQYLLNEDVHIYDFSNMGDMVCDMLSNIPCCYPQGIFEENPKGSQASHWSEVIKEYGSKSSEKIKCYNDFDLKNPSNGESICFLNNYPYTTCEEQYRDMCLYDKNGIACCTKKLDLVHSWLDDGKLAEDPYPYQNWIDYCERIPSRWNNVESIPFKMEASQVYHLGSYTNSLSGIKTRWNFECPTHHPVPTVAIILGCFIPVMVILSAIIGIQFYRGRQPNSEEPEEESGVDEIPKSA